MSGEVNKFDNISNIFSQFTEKNKENVIKTAQSLLEIQNESEGMIAKNKEQRTKSNAENQHPC